MPQIDFEKSFEYKLIYIVEINDLRHAGLLKIGDATVSGYTNVDDLSDNCEILNKFADKRIHEWTGTGGFEYTLLYTTIARKKNGEAFRDYDVHSVLQNSGFKKVELGNAREWFECSYQAAVNAINAVKDNRLSLYPNEKGKGYSPIVLRPEQEEAVNLTTKYFTKNSDNQAHYLWNAKMRFGKTISALMVVKRLEFKKTIIVTHRPVVNQGWLEDFDKVFYDSSNFQYGKKGGDKNFTYLKNGYERYGKKFVYFASLQDLRGSSLVGGNYDKNDEIFNTDWDFVIIDEAHEGTQTALGDDVLERLIHSTPHTKALYLSGTPFNLLSDESTTQFREEEVYTWDYISEQKAKLDWVEKHLGDSNPYESLPKMNIFTYDLQNILKLNNKDYVDIVDEAFSFREFFRVCTKEDLQNPKFTDKYPDATEDAFVHEKDVKRFLDLLVEKGDHNYPFSSDEYRDNFRHTLWMLPGVKEAKALSKLLKHHFVFQNFEIVNVAGDGDEEEPSGDALDKVQKAIKRTGTRGYTITLSCGRLTMGVTIPEWTACLMLSGSNSTSASSYLQTIFRVQSPATIGGKMKTNCYVFDFAPDRTLKIIAEASNLSVRPGATAGESEWAGEFLNFCPVIGFDGSAMKTYNTENMLRQLKRVYIERVVKSGFDDDNLYNKDYFKDLTDEDIAKFHNLGNIIKVGKPEKVSDKIVVNKEGMDNEIHEEPEARPKKELTLEEIEKKEKDKERLKALKILRTISRRIPLMIYGADVEDFNEEITVEEFVERVDDKSWEEFMPAGVTKDLFKEFIRYYDEDIFKGAGVLIRRKVKEADDLPPLERVQKITEIFKTFKNPDRETVLTPWSVVNEHIGECFGGANFFKENGDEIIIDDNTSPRWIESQLPGLTNAVFSTSSNILELNSKSGLYPLYAAVSIYQNLLNKGYRRDTSNLWIDIIENNIYVVCRTEMAKRITIRTLRGFKEDIETNVIVIDNMVKQMSEEYRYGYDKLVEYIENGKTWKKGDRTMKFNAVIGNPPYQNSAKQQIYSDFYLLAKRLGDVVSLIFPVGWQEPKTANNLSKMNTPEVKEDRQIVFIDNRQNIFPGIAGAEWTNFILWKKDYDNGLDGSQRIYTNGKTEKIVEIPINKAEVQKEGEIVELWNCVKKDSNFRSMEFEVSSLKPYGLRTYFFDDQRELPPIKINNDQLEGDIKIYGLYNNHTQTGYSYVKSDYPFPKKTSSFAKYKVFIGKAWGNFSRVAGLGGAYADIIIGKPYEVCTENYLEVGPFDDYETAKKMAKYLMTRFLRALLYLNKFSQDNSKEKFVYIPYQDFSEPWWNESIESIENHLFDKYNVPQDIRIYVTRNIQKRSEINIDGIDD